MLALPPHDYSYEEVINLIEAEVDKWYDRQPQPTMKIVMNSRDFYINDFKGIFYIKTKEGQLMFDQWMDDFCKLPVQP